MNWCAWFHRVDQRSRADRPTNFQPVTLTFAQVLIVSVRSAIPAASRAEYGRFHHKDMFIDLVGDRDHVCASGKLRDHAQFFP